MQTISCTAFVRKPHGAWRDAETHSVELTASMLVDRERSHIVGTPVSVIRPAWRGLTIDGAQCVRFRLPDGRMCATTLVFARCGV
jgi:hypothetical protein